jgi:hypothetical protein
MGMDPVGTDAAVGGAMKGMALGGCTPAMGGGDGAAEDGAAEAGAADGGYDCGKRATGIGPPNPDEVGAADTTGMAVEPWPS